MVESQLEIHHVPEAVRLPFEGLDFVVDSFDDAVGDVMFEVVENPGPVSSQSLGHSGKLFDPGLHGVFEPQIKEFLRTLRFCLLPKELQLLFHGMSDEEGLVCFKKRIEPGLPAGFKGTVVSEQQEATALERLLSQVVQFSLLLPADLIECLVHERYDVEAVKDNVHTGEALANGGEVTAAHVHGDGLKVSCFAGESFQKGTDVLLAFAFNSMEDSSALEIGNDGHVLMALAETELIDSDMPDLPQLDGSVKKGKPFFVDLFDHVPSHSEVLGDRLNRAELEKIQDRERKGANVAVFAVHEGKTLPPQTAAFPTFEPVKHEIEKTPLSPHGTHPEQAPLLPLESGSPGATLRTFHIPLGRPGAEEQAVSEEVHGFVPDTFHAESMVEYGRGHG